MKSIKLPEAPNSIQKGTPLKLVLGKDAIEHLANNLKVVHASFNDEEFIKAALTGITHLTLKERSAHIATKLQEHLPDNYSEAIEIILASLTPPLNTTEGNGLSTMFYMPHCDYVRIYGLDATYNNGSDPYNISMKAQYELTRRFTCEFSIRAYLEAEQSKTLNMLKKWMKDSDPHVRRLCSEGTRPRLPWASKLHPFAADPNLALPILEHLKNDPNLYVRRSVANHVGDIAKDHLDFALELCDRWLHGASKELKWVIRHAVRHPDKKGNRKAASLRKAAK